MSDYSSNFPQQRPSLNLDFANSGKLDSRISYTRSSTGTAFSSEKHLSSENLISQSADLGSWSEGSTAYTTITSNATAAPDGTTTAAQITGLTGTNKKAIYHGITTASTGSHTGVAYVKPNGHEYVQLMFGGAPSVYQNYHLSGSGTKGNGGNDEATIEKLGDWYKITISSTALAGWATNYYIVLVDSNTAARYEDSTSTSSIFAWGANFSTTGQKVFNSTSGQIHREYAPLLKTASADSPRFEYAADGQSVGTALGLLVESQSSNLFARSSGFDYTAAWTKTDVTATAEAISPDGTLNAFAIRETTGTGAKRIHQAATVAAGSVAVSVYAKLLGNERRLVIREDSTTGDSAVFDLSSGTVAATNVGGAGTIESVGNGWYRCTLITSPSGSPGYTFGFWLATATGTNYESYTGDGFSGLILFGAMCENASASSSLISTSGSTATRSADSCSVATSSFYTGGPVTMVGEVSGSGSGYSAMAELRDTASKAAGKNDYLMVWKSNASNTDASSFKLFAYDNSTSQAAFTISGSGGATTIAARLDTNNVGACADGGAVTTDTSAVIPDSLDTLYIGRGYSGYELGSTIKRLALYNVALSDVELQSLTSS